MYGVNHHSRHEVAVMAYVKKMADRAIFNIAWSITNLRMQERSRDAGVFSFRSGLRSYRGSAWKALGSDAVHGCSLGRWVRMKISHALHQPMWLNENGEILRI